MVDGFDAFVLTGGRSERMGRDKALLTVDGVAMAQRVARALEQAGASTVTCVGGDVGSLRGLGLAAVIDDWEDTGPLGGVLTALTHATTAVVVVAPCDLLEPSANVLHELVLALEHHDDALAAVPFVDGVWRPLPVAIRTTGRPTLVEAFEAGERAVHRALARLERVTIPVDALPDADSPEDLPDRR